MTAADVFRRIAAALDEAGIPYMLTQSARQLEDVAGILRMQWQSLDRTYIEKWVDDLGLNAQWSEARRAAGVAG